MTRRQGTGTDADLAGRIGEVILDRGSEPGGHEGHEGGGLAPHDHLVLVHRAAQAHRVTGELLQQAVTAARSGGQSWASLGDELGLSRQGAQQRFGGRTEVAPGGDDPLPPDERWLGPVTAFDEMGELELAGRLGWHTVEAGFFRHKMVLTQTQWEHRRVLWARPAGSHITDGWQVGARAFPWLYLVRDTGRSPEGVDSP